MDQKLFYTISESCRLLSVGKTKLYELIGTGELPVRKLGTKSLIAAADLKRWADGLPAFAGKPSGGTDTKAAFREATS